ncbi:MAG: hypothetical protein J6A53_09215 [Clostridia bacterium]|nr:hypothetical protein [Clostridia bacterium]
MKRAISLVLLILCLAFFAVGCKGDYIEARIDIANSVNFRCEVYLSVGDESFSLVEGDSVYLFEKCFENKKNATKLKSDRVGISTDYIKLHFVGDTVDNAPVKNGKADYSGFVIFSNNTVRFEYDTASEYYQFENGFYNFINNYILILAERQ